MKRLFVCPAVILLALAVCCSHAAVEDNGERTAVMTARKILRDCREMLKIVFDFPNELSDKGIEIA